MISEAAPDLSVVIPTYNRPSVLARCLDALLEQSAPPARFEVIVADDGSPDDTRQIAEDFDARSVRKPGPRVRYVHQPNSGANAARNHAIRAASGRILLLINDDTIATPFMVEEHLRAHAQHLESTVAVLGRVTVSPELPANRLAALHLDRAFNAIGERRELDWRWFFTCNVSVKRALLETGGMFEERMRYHEDLELSERLSHGGLRVVYRPEALGYHYHFLTQQEFLHVAKREASALLIWFQKSPHLESMLAEFGFEPALPASTRRRNRLRSWIVNERTMKFWGTVAECCPRKADRLALKIYLQMYQSAKRAHLLKLLSEASSIPRSRRKNAVLN